jgi:serine/tyrosine/threonine adenylyltransferase
MDYGPFGFLEEYDPLFAKWTGSGQHFGFMNQVSAAYANYQVLVESVVPVIVAKRVGETPETVQDEFLEPAAALFRDSVSKVFRMKLGFEESFEPADAIWKSLEIQMRKARVDWTLLFRELSYLVRDHSEITASEVKLDLDMLLDTWIGNDADRDGSSFLYEDLSQAQRSEWKAWLGQWQEALAGTDSADNIVERMLSSNPKYILREWMLVKAYQESAKDQDAELFSLHSLIQHPYEEGSADENAKYYRRAPESALLAGGTAFMS